MKRTGILLIGLFLLTMIWGTSAFAMPIYFHDCATVGGFEACGSAELGYSFVNPITLKIVIDNTSPTTDSGGNLNAPAITGFGFDAKNAPPVTAIGMIVLATGSTFDITNYWELSSNPQMGNLDFDFLPTTTNGVQGGLINPLVASDPSLTGNDLFWTEATFTVTFDDDPGALDNWYMRFQNLGLRGEGSLNKVPGTPGTPPDPIPEPSTVLLLGVGLLGLVGLGRKRIKK